MSQKTGFAGPNRLCILRLPRITRYLVLRHQPGELNRQEYELADGAVKEGHQIQIQAHIHRLYTDNHKHIVQAVEFPGIIQRGKQATPSKSTKEVKLQPTLIPLDPLHLQDQPMPGFPSRVLHSFEVALQPEDRLASQFLPPLREPANRAQPRPGLVLLQGHSISLH